MSNSADVVVNWSESTAILRLRNPARRNAITLDMWRQINDFTAQVAARSDIRAVLVRGDGDVAFSAGADITDFRNACSDVSNAQAYDDVVDETCRKIEALPQPTIALVTGPAMGAGVALAASCDLRIASEDAFFAVPAGRLGLGYDPREIDRLLRVFGVSATRQMLFTAERLPAVRAYALGAVHMIDTATEIETAALSLVRRIAENAPLTLKGVKVAIRALTTEKGEALLAEAEQLYRAADASADYAEGRRAFAEKRVPRFSGH